MTLSVFHPFNKICLYKYVNLAGLLVLWCAPHVYYLTPSSEGRGFDPDVRPFDPHVSFSPPPPPPSANPRCWPTDEVRSDLNRHHAGRDLHLGRLHLRHEDTREVVPRQVLLRVRRSPPPPSPLPLPLSSFVASLSMLTFFLVSISPSTTVSQSHDLAYLRGGRYDVALLGRLLRPRVAQRVPLPSVGRPTVPSCNSPLLFSSQVRYIS